MIGSLHSREDESNFIRFLDSLLYHLSFFFYVLLLFFKRNTLFLYFIEVNFSHHYLSFNQSWSKYNWLIFKWSAKKFSFLVLELGLEFFLLLLDCFYLFPQCFCFTHCSLLCLHRLDQSILDLPIDFLRFNFWYLSYISVLPFKHCLYFLILLSNLSFQCLPFSPLPFNDFICLLKRFLSL